MTSGPGGLTRTIGLRVRKNAKPVTSEGLAYIFVKMLAGPHIENLFQIEEYFHFNLFMIFTCFIPYVDFQ